MKICAACHRDLPKESYSKKQWKLDKRRCKVCTSDNREVQSIPKKQDNNDQNTNEITNKLDAMYLKVFDKKINDEELFKQPPPLHGDCPICFLQLPTLKSGRRYMTCCRKVICGGCYHAPVYDSHGNKVDIDKQNECPFCRTPAPRTEKQMIERDKKRMEANDVNAMFNLGCYYRDGAYGFKQDYTKALELWHKAAELGYPLAYNGIGYAYQFGRGVEIDKKKAARYYELAAMGGDARARYNLGFDEECKGNEDRALKHHMIAARSGLSESLKRIQVMYSDGHATKEDYTKALKSYQTHLVEIKSSQRDEAAAADEKYRYY